MDIESLGFTTWVELYEHLVKSIKLKPGYTTPLLEFLNRLQTRKE